MTDRNYSKGFSRFLRRLKGINLWYLGLLVILAEIFTAIMNTIMGILWWGEISVDLIKIGMVDALIVSLVVGTIILYMIQLLLESEKKYRVLIQDAGDAICVLDSRGFFLEVNKKAEELSGYARDELLSFQFSRLFPAETLSAATASFEDILRNSSGSLIDTVLQRKDGTPLAVDISGSVIEYSGQKAIQTIIRDITERKISQERLRQHQEQLEQLVEKRTAELQNAVEKLREEISARSRKEEALRASYELTRDIIENSPFGIYIVNSRGVIEYANTSMLSISGASLDESVGNNIYELPSYISIGLPGKIRAAVDGRPFMLGPVTYTSSRGKKTAMRNFTGVPFRDGDARKALIFVEDLTELKHAEEALRESEEVFRQMFEQNEDALFLMNPRTCEILDTNPAALELYGYSRDELIGKTPDLFLSSDEKEECRQFFCGLDRKESLSILQMKNVRKNGGQITVSIRGKVIRLRDREVLYCSFRDTTDKVRLKEESRLLQAKLIQENKMASLGILASGIAHEINNPNNFIMCNSQLLREIWDDITPILAEHASNNGGFMVGGLPFEDMKEALPRLLSGISDGATRIKNIVSTMKDFVRQDRPGLGGSIMVNSVILASASILGNEIKRKTENFRLLLSDDVPAIQGSSQQLQQVIMNLLMNALQALPSKKEAIVISTAYEPEMNRVIIQVRDDGIGMEPAVLERILDPFFTTRLDEGGTGLGLSISYAIIKDHSGSITFESRPGEGTLATIALPVVTESGKGIEDAADA